MDKINVLIIDDDTSFLRDMKALLADKYFVHISDSPELALELLKIEKINIVLLDINLGNKKNGINYIKAIHQIFPEMPIIMVSYYEEPKYIIDSFQNGAIYYINKLSNLSKFITTINNAVNKYSIKNNLKEEDFLYSSQNMQSVINDCKAIAKTDFSVLLLGESGVGKSHLAEIIHNFSSRKTQKFVTVDIPSIQNNLFESELFGHKKGAFTGAIEDKIGRIEYAEGGTLFLDEISEISIDIQAKLLRVLEKKEYEKVGDHKTKKCDVRFIFASNKNLDELVKNGTFRSDLFYRISTFIISIPPLRERKEDVEKIFSYYLEKYGIMILKRKITYSNEAIKALKSYDWPGNVRELINVTERLVIKASSSYFIDEKDINEALKIKDNIVKDIKFQEFEKNEIKKLKFRYFYRLLKNNNWNISKTAKEAGISRQSLYRYLEEIGIEIQNSSCNKSVTS
jgi:DNA-binding NtrC family response regulator